MNLVPTPERFTSRLRSAAVSARVGLWLGITFGIAFVTGLISHYAQARGGPIAFPASPAWGWARSTSATSSARRSAAAGCGGG